MLLTTNFGASRRTARMAWKAVCLATLLLSSTPLLSVHQAEAQTPQAITQTVSYQGLLQDRNGAPINGTVDLTINYYTAGTNVLVYTEAYTSVHVINGLFSLQLGSLSGFPNTTFEKGLDIGISINGGAELTPRTRLGAAPYAIDAKTVGGIGVSKIPAADMLFPIPMDGNGHISSSLLPPITVNGVALDNNNLKVTAGSNISVQTDRVNNQLVIGTAFDPITRITTGEGLTGGGTSGTVRIAISPSGIPGNMISPGTITGRQLDATIAGIGLYQDGLGNLSLAYDPNRFDLAGNRLNFRTDVPIIGTLGSFQMVHSSGSVELGNSLDAIYNTFGTADNAWGVVNVLGSQGYGSVTIVNGELALNGTFNAANRLLQNLQDPMNPSDAATKNYVDNALSFSGEGGDITGSLSNPLLNAMNEGIGDRVIEAIAGSEGEIGDAQISDQLTLSGSTISQSELNNVNIASSSLRYCTLDYIMMTNATLDASTMTNGLFNAGTIDNSDMTNSRITNGLINATPIGTLTRSTGDFSNVTMVGTTDMKSPDYALNIVSGDLRSSAPNGQYGGDPSVVSDRIADVVSAPKNSNTVTVYNSHVTPESTVIVTYEAPNMNTVQLKQVSNGSFTVNAVSKFSAGDRIHYMIINP